MRWNGAGKPQRAEVVPNITKLLFNESCYGKP